MTDSANQTNKQMVWQFWEQLGRNDPDALTATFAEFTLPDLQWAGPYPIDRLTGPEAAVSRFWAPFLKAFPDITRETFIFFGGESNGRISGEGDGRAWVGGLGDFVGTFADDWLSIPANHATVRIRWGEFCRIEAGKVAEIHFLLDIPDLMRQAGFSVLPPDRGEVGLWLPPKQGAGVLLDAQDPAESAQSMQLIRSMIYEGLNSFDEANLGSMGMAQFFREDLQWYGPGGIGGCRSLQEFEDNHQKHWLHAFPNRQVQDLDSLIAEGQYMGGSGWSGVIANHTGQYLDVPATGKEVHFNGIDIWTREGEMLVENWVFVDMIHLYHQFGIDLFDRMRRQIEGGA